MSRRSISWIVITWCLCAQSVWAGGQSYPGCSTGKHCVAVQFDMLVDTLADVKKMMAMHLGNIEKMAREHKIKPIQLDNSNYSVNSNQGQSNWQMYGLLRFRLNSDAEAADFVQYLQSQNYNASLGEPEVICSH